MAKLVIKDLEQNAELDREAMRSITGGNTLSYSLLYKRHPIITNYLGVRRIGSSSGDDSGSGVEQCTSAILPCESEYSNNV